MSPANASRHPRSHTSAAAGSALGAASVLRHSDRRSALSSSMGVESVLLLPRRSMHTMYSMVSAWSRRAADGSDATERYRSASLVSVVAVTEPRKKSPPSTSARRLGNDPARDPTPLSSAATSAAAVCVAYVPSASTAGRAAFFCSRSGDSAADFPSLSSSSGSTRSADAFLKKGVEPRDSLSTANASSTCVPLREYSPMIQRHVPHTRELRTE
mmetsp:Transcript_2161/g.8505  ORF Transcript_2161/g.8505 Transcript_2161/m.8505 type:complete len:214 (+) Transcript_2161:1943-2584(+)